MADDVILSGGKLRTESGVAITTAAVEGFPSTLATTATKPQVPATPNAQDVVTALVTLGIITQAGA